MGQQPHRIKLGASMVLLSLDGIAADWGIEEASVRRLCSKFGLPLLTPEDNGKRYISMYSFETALFEAMLPEAFSGDHELVQAHQALCGALYGHITAKMIRERVLAIAKGLKAGPPSRKGHRPDRVGRTRLRNGR